MSSSGFIVLMQMAACRAATAPAPAPSGLPFFQADDFFDNNPYHKRRNTYTDNIIDHGNLTYS